MIRNPDKYQSMPLGVVLRRLPGVTRWASYSWKAVAVLPGAGPADWQELRREGEAVEYHAATLPLDLHGAETEAYLHGLSAEVPAIYVVMRESLGEQPREVLLVTASPYEAQDYTDSGEEIAEKAAMPAGLVAWGQNFVTNFHEEEVFIKRKRDKKRTDLTQDGIGDPRIAPAADIYASPARQRRRVH